MVSSTSCDWKQNKLGNPESDEVWGLVCVLESETHSEIRPPVFLLQVELVNIGAADIVDGNHKLILGLIWSIILHWQVCARMCVAV